MQTLIAPSMLSADFGHLDRDLKIIQSSGADWLHVDIMDGHFVPNITFGPDQMASIRQCISIPFDVHLMVSKPKDYIPKFAKAGADWISFHLEAEDDAFECIELIRSFDKKVGVVISPDTPVDALKPYIDLVDLILLMGVYPGFGGQAYIPETTQRLVEAKQLIGDRSIRLEIDGGVNETTLPEIIRAGADTIVSGSCLFKGDMKNNINNFHEIIKREEKG